MSYSSVNKGNNNNKILDLSQSGEINATNYANVVVKQHIFTHPA